MKKFSILFIAMFTFILTLGLTFASSTTFSANTNINYLPVSENQFDFSGSSLIDLEQSWESLKAEYRSSSLADFLNNFDLSDYWDKWTSSEFIEMIKDTASNFNLDGLQ